MDIALLIARMAKWVRRPPSRQWVYAAIGALVVAVIVVGIEALGWWPEWLRAERGPRISIR